jgi:hypothetical protein
MEHPTLDAFGEGRDAMAGPGDAVKTAQTAVKAADTARKSLDLEASPALKDAKGAMDVYKICEAVVGLIWGGGPGHRRKALGELALRGVEAVVTAIVRAKFPEYSQVIGEILGQVKARLDLLLPLGLAGTLGRLLTDPTYLDVLFGDAVSRPPEEGAAFENTPGLGMGTGVPENEQGTGPTAWGQSPSSDDKQGGAGPTAWGDSLPVAPPASAGQGTGPTELGGTPPVTAASPEKQSGSPMPPSLDGLPDEDRMFADF